MADNAVNFEKEHLNDSILWPSFFCNEGRPSNIALTLFVYNYGQLKHNVIYYASAKAHDWRWTYKLVIANETLFAFVSTNESIKNPSSTIISNENKTLAVNYNIIPYKGLVISEFCHKAIMDPKNRYLFHGTLEIGFMYYVEGAENSICSLKNFREFCEDLKDLNVPSGSDNLKIHVRNKIYWSNKEVLSACSKVLEEFFKKNQPSPNKLTCIAIDEDSSIFKDVLIYIYERNLNCSSVEYMLEIYRVADKLQIKSLKKKCLDYFENNFSPSNEKQILVTSTSYKLIDLKNATVRYMSRRGSDVLKSETLKEILKLV